MFFKEGNFFLHSRHENIKERNILLFIDTKVTIN